MKVIATIAIICFATLSATNSYAQTTKHCDDADRRAAHEFARQFVSEMRQTHSLAAVRSRYVSSSCQPLFAQMFEIDKRLQESVDCELAKRFGDASFEFLFLFTELALRSDSLDKQDSDPLDALPVAVKQELKSHPLLRQMVDEPAPTNLSVKSLAQLGDLLTTLERINDLSRRYIEEHPDQSEAAAARLKKMEQELNGGKTWSECTSSDEQSYFDLPKGMPLIVTNESVFVFALTRENGEFRVARVILAEQ